MTQKFFARDAATVAHELLGCPLIHNNTEGRIVETEAYYGNQDVKDPASHAFTGKTERNALMFGPAGNAYVYICYGIHTMLNVTTGGDGEPGAVLIRAVAPVTGIEQMRERRGIEQKTALCSGPGKVCEAFDISKDDHGTDLTQGPLRIATDEREPPENTVETTRIGISEGTDLALRFYDADSPHVSQK